MSAVAVADGRVGGIRVLTSGAGPPVLCLHGIGSSAVAFTPQLTGLADTFRVVAWDAPGYASSLDPPEAPGMDGYADAVLALLDGLEIEEATVIGVSWGGVIATRLALRHPSRVRALVLADTSSGSGADSARALAMRARAKELTEVSPAEFARRRARVLVSTAAPRALVTTVQATMARALRLPGYGWAAEAMAETDHTADLQAIVAPTLVVMGEHDAVISRADGEALVAGIAGAQFAVIPAAGHLANQEQPAEFNRAVRRFCDGLATTDPNEESAA